MKKKKGHRIKEVAPGSIGEELELEPGDYVLSIDGNEIEDIFDYEYYVNSAAMTMIVQKADGETWELDIEHDYEDLGLSFENSLMSEYKSCCNKCIFCFIDQMPPGMRDTLYFKDDDSRLSFLQGNYVTLTNMKDRDIERIIRFHLSPINISIQTTNPKLRCKMLNNRFAGEALKKIDLLYQSGTPMNGQIVLCKGINDGQELERTIQDLTNYIPCMESVSVVPVGLSRFRDGLYPLELFTPEEAAETIDLIEKWQRIIFEKHGIHFIHASDEFYMLAGRPLPEAERYDDYIQLENGVGMVRLMTEEVRQALAESEGDEREEELSIATGLLAYKWIQGYIEEIQTKFPNRNVHLYPIENHFFGTSITVAGLITGQDLIAQLKGKKLGKRLLLTEHMFRSGEDVFLDDLTRDDIQKALQVQVDIVKSSGQAFVNAVLGRAEEKESLAHVQPTEGEESSLCSEEDAYQGYELKENPYE
ncbi:DUF512 domain-containing protein [Lachnospiraceae bacterium 62-35]